MALKLDLANSRSAQLYPHNYHNNIAEQPKLPFHFDRQIHNFLNLIMAKPVPFVLLVLVISPFLAGCFGRFAMSEKELRAYYKKRPSKPVFFTIENDSVQLFCATAGADTLPPLLLIHGAPGAWYGSRQMLEDSSLLQHYQLIAVDRPGYNRSVFRKKRRLVPGIETQAVAIHEALRLNRSRYPAVVLGSSYGAPIAASLAIQYPGEFSHLFMLAGALDPAIEKFWWFNKFSRSGPIFWCLPRFMKSASREKFAHVHELKQLLPQWQRLTVPATVLQGGTDRIVNPANLEFARKVLKNKAATFIFLPETGHLIRWQQANLVRKLLLEQVPVNRKH